jgi:hypothetical protein
MAHVVDDPQSAIAAQELQMHRGTLYGSPTDGVEADDQMGNVSSSWVLVSNREDGEAYGCGGDFIASAMLGPGVFGAIGFVGVNAKAPFKLNYGSYNPGWTFIVPKALNSCTTSKYVCEVCVKCVCACLFFVCAWVCACVVCSMCL